MQVICDRLNDNERKKLRKIIKNTDKAKYIGAGATATVLNFDRKRVVRIQESSHDYPADLYLPWVRHCLVSRSKHVPKFSYVAYDVNLYGEVTTVVSVLEKLHEVNDCFDDEVADDLEMSAYMLESYLSGYCTWEPEGEAKRVMTKAFPRRSAYSLRRTLHRKKIYINDLHGGNWMFRKSDGRLVITDPIC